MERKFTQYIGLVIAIIIPVLLTFFAGLITYNRPELPIKMAEELLAFDRNDPKCNQLTDGDECRAAYIEAAKERTTRVKIEKFLSVGVNPMYIRYNTTPFYDEVLKYEFKNGEILDLCTILIYDPVMYFNEMYVDPVTEELGLSFIRQYLFFVYNVNYDNIRKYLIEVEDIEVPSTIDRINTTQVPKLESIFMYNTGDEDEIALRKKDGGPAPIFNQGVTTFQLNNTYPNVSTEIYDYESVPYFNISNSRGDKNKIWVGWVLMNRRVDNTADIVSWYEKNDAKKITSFEINIDYTYIVDQTTSLQFKVALPLVKLDGITQEFVDKNSVESWGKSLRQITWGQGSPYAGQLRAEAKKQYTAWVFGHFVWWICLIVLVISGAFAFLFYAVAKQESKARENLYKKRKR